MQAKIETCGRGRHTATYGQNDLEAFFRKSHIIQERTLPHTPFLVFRVAGDEVHVVLADNAYELVRDHPADTKVMVQWPGRDRSDYFQMTVGDVAAEMRRQQLPLPPGGPWMEPIPAEDEQATVCNVCERVGGPEEAGQDCGMLQPGGKRCNGRMLDAGLDT